MPRILSTGGAGSIGFHVIDPFVEQGEFGDIIIITGSLLDKHGTKFRTNAPVRRVEITSGEALARFEVVAKLIQQTTWRVPRVVEYFKFAEQVS